MEKYFFTSLRLVFKTFRDSHLDLGLISWFTSLRPLFIWTTVYVMSIVLSTHTVISSKQTSRRQAARGSSSVNEYL